MNNVKSSKSTITKQRIAAPKLLILLSALLSLVLDIAVIAILFGNTTEFKFWICPVLLAVLDALFVVKVIFSNFRFAYAINGTVIHLSCVMLLSVYALVSTGFMEERIVFVGFALYLMPAVHLIQSIAILANAFHSANNKRIVKKIFALVMSVVFAVGAGYYASELLSVGFFGQQTERTERTAVYEMNEDGDGYVITGVLKGSGNTVTVPTEFNGMPVTGVNCNLFTNTELEYVVFECDADINFTDTYLLTNANPELKIETPRTEIDRFRDRLYALALENREVLPLANSIAPAGLGANEVYVTFTYTMDTLRTANGEILPTWFGKGGERLDIHEHASHVGYIEHSSVNNDDHMAWCYDNQNKLIFRDIVTADGTASLSGAQIKESHHASVVFDKIYELKVNADNDNVYEISDSYTAISDERPYKLVTRDSLTTVLDDIPGRNGFTLSWSYAGQVFTSSAAVKERLESIESVNASVSEVVLDPIWEISDLKSLTLTANDAQNGCSAIYGSDVNLLAVAEAPTSDFNLSYAWSFAGAQLPANGLNWYEINNIYPSDAGKYEVEITIFDEDQSFTSLQKKITASLDVKFVKKSLSVTWDMPTAAQLVYSASDKAQSIITGVDYSAVENVGSGDIEEIEAALTRSYKIIDTNTLTIQIKDVGNYEISASLSAVGSDIDHMASEKYELVNEKQTVTVTPYRLTVSWGETSFVYNGADQGPTAVANLLGSDTAKIDVTKNKNAGAYTASATINNKNYEITNSSCDYQISKRPITAIVWNDQSFVYNASEQKPTIRSLENIIQKDNILSQLTYSGAAVNAGTHTLVVELPENSNYVFSCSNTKSFTIAKADLVINLKTGLTSDQKIYDGKTHTAFSYTSTGTKGNDTVAEILDLEYIGSAVTAVNASGTPYLLSAAITEKDKYGNYNVTVNDAYMTINKRPITVTINSINKKYDGKICSDSEYGYTISGSNLASGDTADEVFVLNYYGSALSAVNASYSSYSIEATVTEKQKYSNYSLTLYTGTLTISKLDLVITVQNQTKTYDGTTFDSDDFTYTYTELPENESLSDIISLSFTGSALTAVNAGSAYSINLSYASGAKYSNYNIRINSGTLTINKAPLTVTTSAQTREYDGTVGGSFSHTVSGLVGTDTEASLGTLRYSGAATTARNAGAHRLTAYFSGGTALSNYNITYVESELVITQKKLTVTAVAEDREYAKGMNGGKFDFTVTGLAEGDTKQSLGTATYGGSAVSATEVGTYELSVSISGGVSENYDITYISDTGFVISESAGNK